MSKKQNERIKGWFVNFFGALAYLVITLQLLVTFLAYFEPLRSLIELTMPTHNAEPITPVQPLPPMEQSEPSVLLIILSFVIVAIMVSISIYAIIKTPSIIARAGKKVVDRTAEASAPLALKVSGKKDTARNRKKMAPMLRLIFKISLVVLPLAATLLSFLVEQPRIDYSIMQAFAIFLASVAFLLFALQYGLARLIGVKKDNIW